MLCSISSRADAGNRFAGHLTLLQRAVRDWKVDHFLFLAVTGGVRARLVLSQQYYHWSGLVEVENSWVYQKEEEENFFFPEESRCKAAVQGELLLGWKVNPFLELGVETALLESKTIRRKEMHTVARWWDPVQSSQRFGWHYEYRWEKGNVGWNSGVQMKQIRAKENTKFTDDRRTPSVEERWYTEYGVNTTVECSVALSAGSWKLVLEGNWRANLHAEDQWHCRLQSLLQWRFWKFLGMRFQFQMEYEPRIMQKVQYRVETEFGVIL